MRFARLRHGASARLGGLDACGLAAPEDGHGDADDHEGDTEADP